MRASSDVTNLHGDHLGSATNTTGYSPSSELYYPFGLKRSTGEVVTPQSVLTLSIPDATLPCQRDNASRSLAIFARIGGLAAARSLD